MTFKRCEEGCVGGGVTENMLSMHNKVFTGVREVWYEVWYEVWCVGYGVWGVVVD